MSNTHVICGCGAKYMRKRQRCPECSGGWLERKVPEWVSAIFWFACGVIIGSILIPSSSFAQQKAGPLDGVVQPDFTLLPPLREKIYGPSTGSDATGRPHHWETQQGQPVKLPRVKPNIYGPGIGQDQYGRPVVPRSGVGR